MVAHREGVWTAGGEERSPHFPARRRAPWPGRLGPVDPRALALGVLLAAGLGAFVGQPVLLLTTAAAGYGLGLVGQRADARRRGERAATTALREEFGFGPAWPVDLMVRQGEAPTGRDRGVMWVEEERIVFCGGRTSFALAPSQLAGPALHGPGLSGLRLRLVLPLARETPVGPLSLSFWPLSGDPDSAERDASDLHRALNTVAGRRDHALSETGQWPSTALGPGAASPGLLLGHALLPILRGCFLAALMATPLLANATLAASTFIALAVGLNLLVMGQNAVRWRAWRDRRRLG